MSDLEDILEVVDKFSTGPNLRQRISDIERQLENKDTTQLKSFLNHEEIGDRLGIFPSLSHMKS